MARKGSSDPFGDIPTVHIQGPRGSDAHLLPIPVVPTVTESPLSSPGGSPRAGGRGNFLSASPRPVKSSLSPTKKERIGAMVQFEDLDDIPRVESDLGAVIAHQNNKAGARGRILDELVQTSSLSDFPIVQSFVCHKGSSKNDIEASMYNPKAAAKRLGQPGHSFQSAVLVSVFVWIESRWTAWGAKPISFHDFVTSEQRHNLVRLSPPSSAAKCHACGVNPAVWGCPPREIRLECSARQFACQSCYSQGFTFHVGLLEGEHREYKLTALKQLFEQADTTRCGALDFLEYMYFTFSMVYLRRNWTDSRPDKELKNIWDEMTKMKEVFTRWADAEKGLDQEALLRLLDEIDFPSPANLKDTFERRAGASGYLTFRGFIELLYSLLRPESEFITAQPKPKLPRPVISSKPRAQSLCPPDMDSFDHRLAKQHKLLGEGGSSFAWLIHYTNYQMCAKCPKPNINKREINDMMEAARLQRLVHHEHVLRVLGIHNNASWPCILLELAQGGDVSMWQVYDVERPVQLRVLREVASGLNALHTNTPTIIHRDIKGRNILLTSDLVAKVADFDFAVVVRNPSAKTSGVCGTPGYMAPEVLMDKEYWTAVDVFSFGSLMYEVTHKRHPFSLEVEKMADEIKRPTDFSNRCAQLTKDGVRPYLDPAVCPSKMRALIRDCWAHDPLQRPPMAKVLERLAAMEHQFTDSYKLPDAGQDTPGGTGIQTQILALVYGIPGVNRLTRIDVFLLSIVILLLAIAVGKLT